MKELLEDFVDSAELHHAQHTHQAKEPQHAQRAGPHDGLHACWVGPFDDPEGPVHGQQRHIEEEPGLRVVPRDLPQAEDQGSLVIVTCDERDEEIQVPEDLDHPIKHIKHHTGRYIKGMQWDNHQIIQDTQGHAQVPSRPEAATRM
eukprot:Skav201815  [mRNA]  locus=scaffold1071:293205:293642:- [translate_table: standard]